MRATVGWVYFVRAGDLVKIGWARSVKRRLVGLQVGIPERIELVKKVPGSRKVEKGFHVRFKALRVRGEWFRLEGELAAFLKLHDKGPTLEPSDPTRSGVRRCPQKLGTNWAPNHCSMHVFYG